MSRDASVLEQFPDYELVVGIEVHAQLNTKSKIFCSCPNQISPEPNTNICYICAGHPGVLPVLNKKVVEYAIMAALATDSTINHLSTFARKHYFYPDLPKNYQITQSDRPICTNGSITIRLEDGSVKKIRLMRIHMEEDAGKTIHSSIQESLVDLNRAGTPLLEIVSYPDISSTYEVRTYLKELRTLLQYLGICSGNMEDGAFRADTNISVRKKGDPQLGTRCELKNINSFKFISDAVEYEIERQIDLLKSGQKIKQETRLWDTKAHKTVPMRSKEEAADYRYFDEPDLRPISIDLACIESIRAVLPELPRAKFERFIQQFGLSPYEAQIIVDNSELAQYCETALAHNASKQVINWILRDLLGYLKEEKMELRDCLVTPQKLAALVALLEKRIINNHAAQEIFSAVAKTGKDPHLLVKEMNLESVGSIEELEAIVTTIITDHPAQVAQYRAGNQRLFGFFVGKAMAKTEGKGDPKIIQELLNKHLSL